MSPLTIALILIGTASAVALILGLGGLSSPYNRQQKAALKQKLQSLNQSHNQDSTNVLSFTSESRAGFLSQLLARAPFHEALDKLIRRSAKITTADSVMKIMAVAALSVGLISTILTNSVILSIGTAIIAGLLPVANLKIQADRRQKLFEMQFPDALDFMARALRSGHGLTMAFQTVADELPAPVSEEFQQVCDELKFGNSFHDALSKMPERINSSDLSFFVLGILIQRETGGNLSDLLNSLSSTVRDRLKLHGKVRTLAAEGKFSGILLGTLPFALALIMTFLNPTYMGNLWFTPVGHKWLTIGSVMLLLGFAWMWKIAQIKV